MVRVLFRKSWEDKWDCGLGICPRGSIDKLKEEGNPCADLCRGEVQAIRFEADNKWADVSAQVVRVKHPGASVTWVSISYRDKDDPKVTSRGPECGITAPSHSHSSMSRPHSCVNGIMLLPAPTRLWLNEITHVNTWHRSTKLMLKKWAMMMLLMKMMVMALGGHILRDVVSVLSDSTASFCDWDPSRWGRDTGTWGH